MQPMQMGGTKSKRAYFTVRRIFIKSVVAIAKKSGYY